MSRILAFGNNATGVLIPAGTHDLSDNPIRKPSTTAHLTDAGRILWHTWTCTVISDSSRLQFWGTVPACLTESCQSHTPLKFFGHDDIEGFLSQDGHLHDLEGAISSETWADVAMDGLGRVYTADLVAIHQFDNISSAISGRHASVITHPALMGPIHLFALESRCFVATDAHLFELEENRLRLIEETEGFAFEVIPGRRNRLGIITNAGDAYVLDTRDKGLTPLEIDDDVRLLGLGSDFEVVVTQSKVLSRGCNQFGQLGRDGPEAEWAEIGVPADKITEVTCSRWATVLVMKDA